jgi:SAM-dependent methyltransferase
LNLLLETVNNLYKEFLETKDDPYLRTHSQNRAVISRHIESFKIYEPYVKGKCLDWGCCHAIDSCLIKTTNNQVECYGADMYGKEKYKLFHDFAGLQYEELRHPYRLPYEDKKFDTVISSGALEHVPNDFESLKELYRVLKTGGHLIITFLPNIFSYTEFINSLLKNPHHRRKYSKKGIRDLLIHNGFETIHIQNHQILPTFSSGSSLGKRRLAAKIINSIWSANRVLEKIWPIKIFSSNLIIIAKKLDSV